MDWWSLGFVDGLLEAWIFEWLVRAMDFLNGFLELWICQWIARDLELSVD